jgi:hypothetical protein
MPSCHPQSGLGELQVHPHYWAAVYAEASDSPILPEISRPRYVPLGENRFGVRKNVSSVVMYLSASAFSAGVTIASGI